MLPEFEFALLYSVRISPGIHAYSRVLVVYLNESTSLHKSLEDKHTAVLQRTCATVCELHLVPCHAQLELSAFGTNADAQVPPLTVHTSKRALGHAERVTM